MMNTRAEQEISLPTGVSCLLTVEEVALLLRCKVRTIYNMVSQRRIPFRKAGRQLRFDLREIEAWTKPCAEK